MVKLEQLPKLTLVNQAQSEVQKAFEYRETKATDAVHLEFDLRLCYRCMEILKIAGLFCMFKIIEDPISLFLDL